MRKIKVGIFGAGRGTDVGRSFVLAGADIVALCDNIPERLEMGKKRLPDGVKCYDNFDEFINHPGMEAVIVANYFHEHAPFAIKCLEKGIAVFSECISNGTMAEGIELLRAAEKSNAVYMLGENYPFMLFNQEIKKICDGGTLGKVLYAEGEYNHPADPWNIAFRKEFNYFTEHWRNYNARSYYITHSLGPIMYATGATPKKVHAFNCYAPTTADIPTATNVGDKAAIVTTLNDDGSVFRVTGCAAFGAHHNCYRVAGTRGQVEKVRGIPNKVMLRYNAWTKPEGMEAENFYEVKWDDDVDLELIKQANHGGADYMIARYFLSCVAEGRQPCHPFDVHSAITMSSVAILAHRSMLEGGKTYDIPDFRNPEDCEKYKDDRLTPYVSSNGDAPTLPCSSNPEFKATEAQLALFKKYVLDGEKLEGADDGNGDVRIMNHGQ